jgi:hypothetical protein
MSATVDTTGGAELDEESRLFPRAPTQETVQEEGFVGESLDLTQPRRRAAASDRRATVNEWLAAASGG